jgi:hypothetical protein
MKKPTNPIAISVLPMAGQQLPPNFSKAPVPTTTTFDQRDLSQLWKSPNWSSKLNGDNVENIIRSSRLTSASGI